MFANACSKHRESPCLQSEIFVSSGLNCAATERGLCAADCETKSATSSISCFVSLSPNDGIPFPPFVTCRATVALSGFSWSRSGPTRPLEPASASVWQLPQPASAKTFAPGPPETAPDGVGCAEEDAAATCLAGSLAFFDPPQAGARS